MSTNHTPGPWQIVQADTERLEIDGFLVRATGAILMGRTAKKLTCEGIEGGETEFMANLHLIAAAPDLLYCLEELLEHIEWRRGVAGEVTGPNDCTHRAKAAIAKARAA
jgi:hypothetical protein